MMFADMAARGGPMAALRTTDQDAIEATQHMPSSGVVVRASDYSLTANTTAFTVDAPDRGIAVLTETYVAKDFRATLNGARVPYFRVNHAFKAVAIPGPGRWRVVFEYRPHHWDLALGVAACGPLVSLLGGLGVLALPPRSLRRDRHPE